jgi:1-aminocyclopropane-1-carboxylate deaminase
VSNIEFLHSHWLLHAAEPITLKKESLEKVPLEKIMLPVIQKAGIELWMRRDDLIHAEISGNKFYKLFFLLREAHVQGYSKLVSFGGAYSNHLYALAAAGKHYGFKTLGIVRGEAAENLSPTLKDAQNWGMKLIFVDRQTYLTKTHPTFLSELESEHGRMFVIPEGGACLEGARGMQLLGQLLEQQLNDDYTHVCIASATGTSVAGLAAGVSKKKKVVGFSVLKGEGDLGKNVAELYRELSRELNPRDHGANWRLISGFHAGGYAKRLPSHLADFWNYFEAETGIPLDPVYNLKMCWGIYCLAQQGYWPKGSKIIAIHSGGLQGTRGFNR